MVDGISVWVREMRRPENERSPTIQSHELIRARRLADLWENEIDAPLMNGSLNLAQLYLVAGLDFAATRAPAMSIEMTISGSWYLRSLLGCDRCWGVAYCGPPDTCRVFRDLANTHRDDLIAPFRSDRPMTNRSLNLAQLIFEAEPDAVLGRPEAVARVTQALAKITGALLATTLVRDGDEALGHAVLRAATLMEEEARRTAGMVRALEDGKEQPDKLN